MEDMKVTATGYDFRPAHAAMQRYVDGNLRGELFWGGRAGTQWWISPKKNTAGLIMAQREMGIHLWSSSNGSRTKR
jgi:hypothetical protein